MAKTNATPALHDVLTTQHNELLDALTLLMAAEDMTADLPHGPMRKWSSPQSRLQAMLIMAREKLERAVNELAPHV